MKTNRIFAILIAGMAVCLAGSGWAQGQGKKGKDTPKQEMKEPAGDGKRVRLREIRKFATVADYEKSLDKKPQRIMTDDGMLRFYDAAGNFRKERKYRHLTNKERSQIAEEQKKRGKNEKDTEIYYEEARLLPNDKGVLIKKTTTYYEGGQSAFELIDSDGKTIGNISEDVELHPAPNGEYFVGLYPGRWLYRTKGEVGFFNAKGERYAKVDVFEFEGMDKQVLFLKDSSNVVFTLSSDSSLSGAYLGGIAFLSKEGKVLVKKVTEKWKAWHFAGQNSSNLFLETTIDGDAQIEAYTLNGELRWIYPLGKGKTIRTSFDDENVLAIAEFPITKSRDLPGQIVVHLVNTTNGKLDTRFTLATDSTATDSYGAISGRPLQVQVSTHTGMIVFSNVRYVDRDNAIREICLVDKKGQIRWKKSSKQGVNDRFEGSVNKNGEVVIRENNQVGLFKIEN